MLLLLSQFLRMAWKLSLKLCGLLFIFCLFKKTISPAPQSKNARLIKRSLSFSCPLKALMF